MNGLRIGTVFVAALAGCALFSGCVSMGANVYSAAQYGDMAQMKALVAQGADVNAPGDFGSTPLYQAACNGNAEMVGFLIDHGARIDVMNMGMTPLNGAIWQGHTDVVRVLVQKGANVNLASDWGTRFSPILYCAAYGNAEIARMLVDAGADPNSRDVKGRTAADYAVEYKKLEVLAVLRKAGAPVSYTGDKAKDIVMAVLSEDRDKVRSLLEEGVDPNTKTKSGKSLLQYAVENKWPDIVGLLVKKGVNLNEKDKDGWTVMMQAAFESQTEMLKAFEQAGAKVSYSGKLRDDLLVAVLFGDREKVKALLAQGGDVNGKYRYNSPLLNYAAYKNDRQMVELLLDNKANPNIINDNGHGALTVAFLKGGAPLARLMIERGAEVNIKGGLPALPCAIMTGDAALVKDMLAKGAQVDASMVRLSEGRDKNYKNVNFPEITALIKPELLRRQMLRAAAAVESAQSAQDYAKAIAEYNLAREIAPELPEIYYNLGLVQDKAGAYADAIASLQEYLRRAPTAPDAQAVKDMIYKLEYKRDQSKN